MTTLTVWIYVQCVVMFIIGQGLTLFWWDIPQNRKLAKIANYDFDIKEWWRKEWNMVVGTNLLGIAVFIGLDQLIHWKPQLLDTVKWFFLIFGAMGSVIGSRYGSYRQMIMKIIDKKTNIADGIDQQNSPQP